VFEKFKKLSLVLDIIFALVVLVVIGVSIYIIFSLKKEGF
jgi:hypothetical protein